MLTQRKGTVSPFDCRIWRDMFHVCHAAPRPHLARRLFYMNRPLGGLDQYRRHSSILTYQSSTMTYYPTSSTENDQQVMIIWKEEIKCHTHQRSWDFFVHTLWYIMLYLSLSYYQHSMAAHATQRWLHEPVIITHSVRLLTPPKVADSWHFIIAN